jgi:SAM-dependent methyltransferase
VSDYLDVNRALWDERADVHAASPDYAFDKYVDDPELLSDVVRFDLPRLGSVAGLRGVHLQCHIGTDTLSLARLGARMTGLDFSPPALTQARALAVRAGADIDFVRSDTYSALSVLPAHAFDLVYTGIGALCWLPSVSRWASVVSGLLAPGGRLFLREGHPMLWSLADPDASGRLLVEFPYFERDEPTLWDEPGTYVATDHEFVHTKSVEWNHGIGEIVSALLSEGLRITQLVEHDSVPWDAFPGFMQPVGGGEFRLADRPWRLPHTYTLQAAAPE